MWRRKGFTLIELLVVIAIIGILAAMLFPVFARARESARKTQCLANVKNIAMGMQIYLTDYDALPPWETRQEVLDYVASGPGGGSQMWACPGGNEPREMAYRMNPYLQWPVILDEYIKSREVWMCPSAKVTTGASFIVAAPDFLGWFRANEGAWGSGTGVGGPCDFAWPNGWGGAVTDSIAQATLAIGAGGDQVSGGSAQDGGAFRLGITWNRHVSGMKLSAVGDPSSFLICGDGGADYTLRNIFKVAFPEGCCVECGGSGLLWGGGWPPARDCGILSEDCGECYALRAQPTLFTDNAEYTRLTRHLGGVNVGWMDGHASWQNSRGLINRFGEGALEGVSHWCPSSTGDYRDNCGWPPGPGITLPLGDGAPPMGL